MKVESVEIRPFRNSDVPHLVSIWGNYWTQFTHRVQVTAGILDQAILARNYFDPNRLLLAECDDTVVGWCQALPSTDNSGDVLVGPFQLPDSNANDALLAAAESSAGSASLRVGSCMITPLGYAGMSPVDAGIGVWDCDTALIDTLVNRGYQAVTQWQRLELSLSGFRPPINRDAMRLRRSCRIEESTYLPSDVLSASETSHLDMQRQRLLDIQTGERVAEIQIWFSDQEAGVMESGTAILSLHAYVDEREVSPELLYLVSTCLSQATNRGVTNVQVAIEASKSGPIQQLQKLGFLPTQTGTTWERGR